MSHLIAPSLLSANFLNLEKDIKIIGVSNDEKTSWKQISQVSRHPANGGLVKVTSLSGKTTTAAKLAAWNTLRQGLRVALLSMDCYRIGATDQLRTYAQIMRLPCEIVLRQQDLARALARHHDKDLIIIDTAGKSPYDEAHIQERQPCR